MFLLHPSRDIVGTKGDELTGRKIVLGITGSVAAVRCPELSRELMRLGADVRAVMSPEATRLITPQLMHWATGNEVVSELTGRIEHVELAEWADLILVAPATANTIGKVAGGVDDTPVTSVVSVALGLEKPVALVPAMHGSMYDNRLVRDNLERLREAGIHVLDPVLEEGKAKIPPDEGIVGLVRALLRSRDLESERVLVTAGPTIEHIDPVKIITNRSSGKMGVAVARAAAARGADVTLVYGPGTATPPAGVRTIRVERTAEMRDAVVEELQDGYSIVVGTAAAQDFVVEGAPEEKIRHTKPARLKLAPAPRVLGDVRELAPDAFVVGFKAEVGVSDEQLLEAAKRKIDEDRLDMVVANDVARAGAGFGTDTNDVLVVNGAENRHVRASKLEIANIILDEAAEKLRGR